MRKETTLFNLMDQVICEQLGYLLKEEVDHSDYVVWVETLNEKNVDLMFRILIEPEKLDEVKRNEVKRMVEGSWKEYKEKKRLFNQNRK